MKNILGKVRNVAVAAGAATAIGMEVQNLQKVSDLEDVRDRIANVGLMQLFQDRTDYFDDQNFYAVDIALNYYNEGELPYINDHYGQVDQQFTIEDIINAYKIIDTRIVDITNTLVKIFNPMESEWLKIYWNNNFLFGREDYRGTPIGIREITYQFQTIRESLQKAISEDRLLSESELRTIRNQLAKQNILFARAVENLDKYIKENPAHQDVDILKFALASLTLLLSKYAFLLRKKVNEKLKNRQIKGIKTKVLNTEGEMVDAHLIKIEGDNFYFMTDDGDLVIEKRKMQMAQLAEEEIPAENMEESPIINEMEQGTLES